MELIHAILVHENARPGYGDKFEAEIADIITQLVSFADSGVTVHDYPPELEVRAFLLDRFTYTVFVAKIDGEPMIMAVAHQHQEPGYWAYRLKK